MVLMIKNQRKGSANMKKTISILLVLSMLLVLSGCGSKVKTFESYKEIQTKFAAVINEEQANLMFTGYTPKVTKAASTSTILYTGVKVGDFVWDQTYVITEWDRGAHLTFMKIYNDNANHEADYNKIRTKLELEYGTGKPGKAADGNEMIEWPAAYLRFAKSVKGFNLYYSYANALY